MWIARDGQFPVPADAGWADADAARTSVSATADAKVDLLRGSIL
jgi:hypothetical protein